MIEREWKYIISDSSEIIKLKKIAYKKIGIVQWYLKNEESEEERVRLELIPQKTGIMKKWTRTTKVKTNNALEREEREETIFPNDELVNTLFDYPLVAKLRYFISDDPEITLDEYIEFKDKLKYDIEHYHILEVEEKSTRVNFDDLKLYGIDSAEKIHERNFEKFENKNIARKIQGEKSLETFVKFTEFLVNKLSDEVTVVMPSGQAINRKYNNLQKIKKDLNDNKNNLEVVISNSPELQTLDLLRKEGWNIRKVIFILNEPFEELTDEEIEEYEKSGLKYEKGLNRIYYYLKYIIKTIFDIEVEYEKINFNPDDEKTSRNTLNELWEKLDKIFEKEKKVIIDIAPGVKYIGVILALYALFNKRDFYYKYERQSEIVKFPAFGIDWDYNFIDEMSAILKTYKSKNKSVLNLPNELHNIIKVKDFEIISFYPIEKIEKSFKEKREMPFGYGEKYLNLIEDERLKNYIREGILKKWSLMWIGDQIPETVEHSQRHSKRLMEFTVNLINVIGEEEFLSPFSKDELNSLFYQNIKYRDILYFLLGVAINVHDLGHTYPKFKRKDGKTFFLDSLPSLVRDLHNELTVQLIDDPFYDILAINTPFKGEKLSDIFKEKTDEIVQSIKLISKYHRGYLGIDSEINGKISKFVQRMMLDTRKMDDVYNPEDKLLKKITLYVTKWLKFIDGTDVQADRIITESYHKNRLERTRNEILYLVELLKNGNYNLSRNMFDQILQIEKSLKFLITTNNGNKEELDEIDTIAVKLEDFVYENIESPSKEIEIIDKIAFKSRQFNHFEKHKSVSAVIPEWLEWKKGSNLKTLHIRLVRNLDLNTSDEVLEKIKKDIESEMEGSNLRKDLNIQVIVEID
ncbi:hypothetical protein [Fervidobacterium sp. 2310opik-2]|uniref:hypothetical protein n=1 Tax=Fervidobacterium sp. 2310opik-2 TaxID=1755815 RepID=UPI0013E0BBA3|nr:hypothetical protein [Fervidobacterium sp. 2310opik-2]KAF2961314.1 hypothetical protein AS161_01855 [Fervidobacterium sp. 2310opik-2]